MRGVLVVMVLAGCDGVFGLTRLPVPDAAPTIDATSLDCPPTYMAVAGSATQYRFADNLASWRNAADDCIHDQTLGIRKQTHLVVMVTDAERGYLYAMNRVVGQWIGLTDLQVSGTYIWITDEYNISYPPATGAPWGGGEPNNFAIEQCVYMGDASGGRFYTKPCTDAHPYICECDAYPDNPARSKP